MSYKRGKSSSYTLTKTQVEATLKACQDLDERITIGCQIFLGFSISELSHLKPDWVTIDGYLRIPTRQMCNCAECARLRSRCWRPKASPRTLPIPDRMKKDLSEFFRLNPYGIKLSRTGLYYRTKRILKRAKIKFPGLSDNTTFPQALRHTCDALLEAGGMNAEGRAYFMGWKTVSLQRVKHAKEHAIAGAQNIFR